MSAYDQAFNATSEELGEAAVRLATYSKYVVHHEHESYDYYIGRSSPFGNPYHIGQDGTRAEVIQKFRVYLTTNELLLARVRHELRGKILGCHCKPLACHGQVLAEIANEF